MAALLLLVLYTVLLVEASVVEDFRECRQFLYKGTSPMGILGENLRKICQHYANVPRYATLYDAQQHIPVYSAYTFKKSNGEKREDYPWMYEPQLATLQGSGNMKPFPDSNIHQNFEDSQAVLNDYADVALYERGQLNPDQHQAEPNDKAATYSLTNVVPQVREFNIGPWFKHEDRVRRRLNNYCRGQAYVVTGVTTSGNMIRRANIDRVGIPEYMWTAYCCTDYDKNAPFYVRYKFPSFAAYGLNDRVNNHVVELPVKRLENVLKSKMHIDKDFQLFYKDCIP